MYINLGVKIVMDKDKTIEFSRNIAVAASNLIPGIGGVLAVF